MFLRVGPLHADAQYTVTAEKEGYVLSQVDGKPGDFKASKLAEVIVQVRIYTYSIMGKARCAPLSTSRHIKTEPLDEGLMW